MITGKYPAAASRPGIAGKELEKQIHLDHGERGYRRT
jgi:hypothetical protein